MSCPTPIRLKDRSISGLFHDVPCGQCGNCLALRRSYWTFRIREEAKNFMHSAFITLTYSEPPLSQQNVPTVEKKHLQDFFKRLRHYLDGRKIRYYAVGEYGTKTQRPHYHAIIFGLHPLEIEFIHKAWNDYKDSKDYQTGHAMATSLNDARIHYTTKYHLNYKPKSDRDQTRQSEFALMSRKPGIGANYLERATTYHRETQNHFVMLEGFKQPMPRYYFNKIWSDPFEQKIQSNLKKIQSEKAYNKQIEQLKAKKYDNPELEHFERQIEKGRLYKSKKDDGSIV